jgi:hypothetical protein
MGSPTISVRPNLSAAFNPQSQRTTSRSRTPVADNHLAVRWASDALRKPHFHLPGIVLCYRGVIEVTFFVKPALGFADATAFDYDKLGLVALTTLNEQEKRETPAGNYYIYDGVHKSIVLGKRLLRGETEYEPVQVLLLTPRRL